MAMLLTMTLCLSAVCVNFMLTFDYRNVTISCSQRNKYEFGPKCMDISKTIEFLRTYNKFKFSRSQIIAFISNSFLDGGFQVEIQAVYVSLDLLIFLNVEMFHQ